MTKRLKSTDLECIFSTYDLVWSNIRNSLDAEKAETFVKIFWFCRAEEDCQWHLLKTVQMFFWFFQVLQISLLFILF